jgi:hypothetical protein
MSRIITGILSTVAVSVTFGAIQFASGSDLVSNRANIAQEVSQAADHGINRAAKADRGDLAGTPAQQGMTISVQLDSLAATSLLIRLPRRFGEEARTRSPGPGFIKEPSGARKSTVACEPVVSVLTDVAKQLEPGRCVT